MKDFRSSLVKTMNAGPLQDGRHATPVPGVSCVKFSRPKRRERNHWRACLGLMLQGSKEITVGQDIHRCGELDFTATPIDLPVISRVPKASAEEPFLALLIDLEPLVLSEVTAQLEKESVQEMDEPLLAMFSGKANDKMLEAFERLLRLFQNPEEARVLGPLVTREILFHLLRDPQSAGLRQFVRSGSKTHRISQVIHTLRSELSEELDVPSLAKAANMSRSAFFKHFKDATAMSPIQYQKRLRLLEARRLMIEGETAESSAFLVGYKSASQFSREYSRMFGKSPLRDTSQEKKSTIQRSPL